MAQNGNGKDTQDIDIRLFYAGKGPGEGWAGKLIKSLEPDKPVVLTEYVPSTTKLDSAASSLSQAAKREGVKISIREINGVKYVMRLRTEQEAVASE